MKKNLKAGFLRKETNAFFTLFVGFVACSVIYLMMFNVLYDFYEVIARAFPGNAPIYNRILEKNQYDELRLIIAAISAIPSVMLASYLTVLFNSYKKHFFFLKTGGFIKFPDACRLYVKSFLLTDIIAAVLVSAIFAVLVLCIPEFRASYTFESSASSVGGLLGFLRYFVIASSALYMRFGFVGCLLIPMGSAMLGGALAIPHSVRRYQGDALAHSLE